MPSFLLSLFTFTYLPPGRSGHVAFVRDARAGIEAVTITDDEEIGELALLRHAPGAFAEVFRAAGVQRGTVRRDRSTEIRPGRSRVPASRSRPDGSTSRRPF